MEAKYLKDNLGSLTSCLKEVAEKRPHDPIEYIAFWLRKHVENARLKAQVHLFSLKFYCLAMKSLNENVPHFAVV